MRLTQIIEALLFASDAPLAAADLARVDERLDEDTITAVVDELRREYDEQDRSFQIYEVAGGYQLLTRPEYSIVLERWETVPQTTKLSLPALEVLAIIAYRQPLGRNEIEEIRGVQSAAVLRTLQDRSLIEPVGRAEGLGRPMLYGTTKRFLEHFGFRSLEDLPRPDELPVVLRERPAPVAEEEALPIEGPGQPDELIATTPEIEGGNDVGDMTAAPRAGGDAAGAGQTEDAGAGEAEVIAAGETADAGASEAEDAGATEPSGAREG
jgi:segregation and condensation protein B